MDSIPFNIPAITGRELEYLQEVFGARAFCGNGAFTARCHDWLRRRIGAEGLITNSCTAALEMAAIVAGIEAGDEVIMPSFTFPSTANAMVLRRGVPVFVDIRDDTLNLDEAAIEAAITPRTKAVCVVHYAGVCAEMDAIREIARHHRLRVIEDAAHAVLANYRGRPAGTLGDFGCFSFHESKNVMAGEAGALVVNDPDLAERAFRVWEYGTNRRAFQSGQVDRYSWQDYGSSFLPSEMTAAVLYAQLEQADGFNARRRVVWDRYHAAFESLEQAQAVRRPVVPPHCAHNAHIYYLLVRGERRRDDLMAHLDAQGIAARSHYVPLHSAPAASVYARSHGPLPITERTSESLIRLPLHAGMPLAAADRVIDGVHAFFHGPQ